MLEDESLVPWDPEILRDWIGRTEAYTRLWSRANAGRPALTVQVYADMLRTLRLRRSTESVIDRIVGEIREQFVLLDLTADRAESFASAAVDCVRLAQDPTQTETWFAWQFALNRREGHRIMTKAPQRYRGLVDPANLA